MEKYHHHHIVHLVATTTTTTTTNAVGKTCEMDWFAQKCEMCLFAGDKGATFDATPDKQCSSVTANDNIPHYTWETDEAYWAC